MTFLGQSEAFISEQERELFEEVAAADLADEDQVVAGVLRADRSGVPLAGSGTLVRLQVRQLRIHAPVVVVVVAADGPAPVARLEVRRRPSLELDV